MGFLLLCLATASLLSYSVCADIDCNKLGDGYYKIEGDCQHYYECANEQKHLKECPPGTSFDEKKEKCDHTDIVPGCMSPEAEKCLDKQGNRLDISFRVPGSCTEYYMCSQGGFQKIECQGDLVFNPEIGACDYKSSSPTCIPGTTTSAPSTVTRSSTTPSSDSTTTTPSSDSTTTTPSSDSTTTTPSSGLDSTTTGTFTTEASSTQSAYSTTPKSSTTNKPTGFSYVGFVVDDTGSMYNEIEAVKQWLTNCIDGSYSTCATAPTGGWIITTFNDPYVGDVLGPTNNINEIIEYIDGLDANAGGDCPELAISGLLNLVEAVPDVNSGCKVFFFSDATAKDYYMENAVYDLYEKKGCTFLPWLTGCCGVCEDPCASLDPEYCINKVTDNTEASSFGIEKRSIDGVESYGSGPSERIYYSLASKTEGSIVLSDKPSSPEDMLDEMEEELTLGFCPTELIAGPPPLGYESESDCNSTGSCWDRSLLKCFCVSETEPCPKDPISNVTCDASTVHEFYGNANDCTTYYECSYGSEWLRPCSVGTVFDTEKGLCNHLYDTAPPCGTRSEDLD